MRRANHCEIMLTKVKMPLPDVLVRKQCFGLSGFTIDFLSCTKNCVQIILIAGFKCPLGTVSQK